MTKSKNYLRTIAEYQFYKEMISENPTGILSLVSDTFNLFDVITEFLPRLKDEIMSRDGKLVIRPDSGDPVDILCGSANVIEYGENVNSLDMLKDWAKETLEDEVREDTPHGEYGLSNTSGYFRLDGHIYKIKIEIDWNRYDKQYYFIEESTVISCEEVELAAPAKGVIELLWDLFGGTVNEQGYKVLDPHIGAIYGDSITLDRQIQIYERLAAKGFAATNIVLGVGSYTYQMNTRDTFGFAAKGAWFEANGEAFDIYKDPATDDGTKKSLKGLIMVDENLEVHTQCSWEEEETGLLHTIYEDGNYFNGTTLTQVREKLDQLIHSTNSIKA